MSFKMEMKYWWTVCCSGNQRVRPPADPPQGTPTMNESPFLPTKPSRPRKASLTFRRNLPKDKEGGLIRKHDGGKATGTVP